MIVQSFRSVMWVGAVAGAALSCYMVSLRVASERAALESVETRILLAKRDVRALDTELSTRGRLRQLERWNVEVLALSAPTEGQFLEGEVQLASLMRPEPRDAMAAPVVLATAPAPKAAPVEAKVILADFKPVPKRVEPATAAEPRVVLAGAPLGKLDDSLAGDIGKAAAREKARPAEPRLASVKLAVAKAGKAEAAGSRPEAEPKKAAAMNKADSAKSAAAKTATKLASAKPTSTAVDKKAKDKKAQ